MPVCSGTCGPGGLADWQASQTMIPTMRRTSKANQIGRNGSAPSVNMVLSIPHRQSQNPIEDCEHNNTD